LHVLEGERVETAHLRVVLSYREDTLLVNLLKISNARIVDCTLKQSVEVEIVVRQELKRINLELLNGVTPVDFILRDGIDVKVEWSRTVLSAGFMPGERANAYLNRSVLLNDLLDLLVSIFGAVELGLLSLQARCKS